MGTAADAVERATRRLEGRKVDQAWAKTLNVFTNKYNLGEEVELGLRVLREEIAQKLMDDSSLVKQLRRSRGEHDHDEVMVSALSHVDVEVGAIVRALLESKRRKAVSSSHARTSHRHRSSDRHRSRHRLSDHHSRRKSRSRRRSRRESPSRGRRRSHHDGAKDTTRDREVDRYVAEKDDHHKSKRHPRGAEDVAEMNTGSQSTGARTLNSEADLESWLRGLDPGRDALKQDDHHKSKRQPRGAEDVAEMNTGSQSTGARTLNSEADLESWLRGLDPGRDALKQDDHHKSKRQPRGAEDVAEMNTGSQSTGARTSNSEADLESWLRGLDQGRGIMLQYRDALKQELRFRPPPSAPFLL